MEKQNLSKHDLKRDLVKMTVSCIGVKENTAKRKASELFYKYEELFNFSIRNKRFIEQTLDNQKLALETLLSGKIHFMHNKVSSFILLKDIEQIDFGEDTISIILKSQRKLNLDATDFKYLKYLYT